MIGFHFSPSLIAQYKRCEPFSSTKCTKFGKLNSSVNKPTLCPLRSQNGRRRNVYLTCIFQQCFSYYRNGNFHTCNLDEKHDCCFKPIQAFFGFFFDITRNYVKTPYQKKCANSRKLFYV